MSGHVGRPAIPSTVHQLRGTMPSAPITGAQMAEFNPDVELPDCPTHLKGEASKEYKRLGEELKRYSLVSKVDRGVLAMLATVWARYVWAESKIAEYNKADPAGERGLVDRTPNDYKVMSVYVQISNAAIAQYLKLAAEFGLSPSSRSRVRLSVGGQMPLPGVEEPDQGPSLRSFAA